MSDEKREAHNLYVQYIAISSENIGTTDSDILERLDGLQGKISVLILQFLCQCRPQERFRHNEFPNVIMLSSRMDDFEAEKAVQAFFNLEKYLLLLCIMPWKQEYQKLKKYGGFYQTKIESHLRGAESIFRLIGFTERMSGLMILTHPIKPDVMQYIAFECFCAALECKIISEIWRRTSRGKLKIHDVVNIRLQTAGSADIVVSFIESKYGVAMSLGASNEIDCGKVKKDEKSIGERSPTDTFRNKLQEHLKMAEKHGAGENAEHDIPFIDDELKDYDHTPSCFDDHLMASLQIVGTKEVSPLPSTSSSAGMRPSQEWSFVREGLEKNYGKKYFEGIRKDILSNEKESDLVTNPKMYENSSDQHRKTDVQPAHAPINFQSRMGPSTAHDSAYISGSSTYPGHYQYVPTLVPHKYDSDIIKRGAAVYNTSKTAKTEPLLRQSVDSGIKSGFHTGYIRTTDNTKTYASKRSSLPVNQADTNVKQGSVTSHNSSIVSSKLSKTVRETYHAGGHYSGNAGANMRDGNNAMFMNGTTNTSVNASRQEDKTTWNCTFCTFSNPSSLIICSMCSKSREVPEMDSPSAGTKLRVCGKCTLVNSKDSTECSACGHLLNNTQTVV